MTFEKNDTVKIIFAMILAMTLGIAVALGSVAVSAKKKPEATVFEPDIKVYIRGAVNNPGLYEVGADLRLCELIDKAGGTTENASLDMLNLAAILIDGTTVTVPSAADTEPEKAVKMQASDAEPDLPAVPEEAYIAHEYYTTAVLPTAIAEPRESPSHESNPVTQPERVKKIESGTININSAGKDELMQLPGVGEATANKIVTYREQSGGFNAVEEIMNVSGIGEKKFEAMKQFITVE